METYRKFFVIGNWKMNGNKASIDVIIEELNSGNPNENTEVVVAPPAVYLDYVRQRLDKKFGVAAQNCWKAEKGAYDGEISTAMILDVGCKWVILGHLERRQWCGENDELIGEKVAHAQSSGMNIIVCIGETREDYDAGKSEEVIFKQTKAIADNVSDWSRVVMAYEALWVTPVQAQEIHERIRQWLSENVTPDVAKSLRILHGGSVNTTNCRELANQPDIDGFLIGGAFLKHDLIKIINSAH